jgi:hypothetical protein
VAGCCEHGNEPLGSIDSGNFLSVNFSRKMTQIHAVGCVQRRTEVD